MCKAVDPTHPHRRRPAALGWALGAALVVVLSLASAAHAQVLQEWVAFYNGPGNFEDWATALAVDAAGNVYVTGSSYGTNYDYATLKCDADGQQQWVARYNGPGNGSDIASALAVDAAGNVYVTGSSYGTNYDYATLKCDAAGQQQWVARYNGPGNGSDIASALAVDAAGNVYVTGWSAGSGTYNDYATIKYDTAGQQQWVARYNGPVNGYEYAMALGVDAAENVYVTGYSRGSGTSWDYATIRYDAAGQQQWVARYNGPGNGEDAATALAVDAAGNAYVTGYSDSLAGSSINYDYATIKYDAAGQQQWVARYNGPGNRSDIAGVLAVDASGNVYVTGESYGGSGTYDDYATIKYDAAGQQQWVARYNGPENAEDEARAIDVDAAGNVYVTGGSVGSGTSYDYATIKYDAAGQQQWVARYNGPGKGYNEATALAVDAAGNVYVTGYATVGWDIMSNELHDYATIKYAPDCNSNGTPDDQDPDCNTNGIPDECDITGGTGTDCNANAVLDECEPLTVLCGATPQDQSSLWRSAANTIRLTFGKDITVPQLGQIRIQQMLDGGVWGADLSGNFTFTVEDIDIGGGGMRPRVLKIVETTPCLTHRTWIAIRNAETPKRRNAETETSEEEGRAGSARRNGLLPLSNGPSPLSPEGTKENSPGRQPWVWDAVGTSSPEGAKERGMEEDYSAAPPGLGLIGRPVPRADALGYPLSPLRGWLSAETVGYVARPDLDLLPLRGWLGVAPFEVQYVVMVGDVNNDGKVLAVDLSAIFPKIPTANAADQERADVNGDGKVLAGDLSAVFPRIPSATPPKPSGH